MSDVVEKTLTALPGFLSLEGQPPKLSPSSKLGTLVRSISELTSKHEEEKLISKELAAIKEQISSPTTTLRQMKEIMVRAIYCEMLGYEASFTYIHAIKLAQQGSVLEKRVGYLAVSLFLNESHELLLLLVNTVHKDLQSTNLMEVCMALTVVSQIFPKDMIPAVLPLVEEKLTHTKEIIRKKAVLALYKFYLIAPNQVQHIHDKFRRALCDKDPGVMIASLHIYLLMIKENPDGYKDLTESFVAILKQVVGGKLPVDFTYHSVPAPWLQMQLLRILAHLGREDQRSSEMMYDVLDESIRRAEINHNITYAILFECVKTIYTIHPKSELLEKAAKCIGKFVLSPKINLKYLGLKALTYVVQQDANLALQHQMTIIECLDHTDPIIKRETLELLYRITNGQNVTIIVEKMLDFLRMSKEEHSTIDLVGKVAELAEKYAPDNGWFIQTMNAVFLLGGDVLQTEIPYNFLRLLAEGCGSEKEDRQLRLLTVDSYLSLLERDTTDLPQRYLQVISWVLGEYTFLKVGLDPAVVTSQLMGLLQKRNISTETRCWILAAMCKLCWSDSASAVVTEMTQTHTSSLDTVLRQQAMELQLLATKPQLRANVMPCCNASQEIEVDSSLSFLDGFVSDALAAGAAPYKPPHQRQEELSQEKALNLEPYDLSLPVSLSTCSLTDRPSPPPLSISSGQSTEHPHNTGSDTLRLEGVRRVWWKQGYLPQMDKPVAAEAPAASCLPKVSQQQGRDEGEQDTSLPATEAEIEKRQLASSLFVGLDGQNSLCLLGKPDVSSHRYRRRARPVEAALSDASCTHGSIAEGLSYNNLVLDSLEDLSVSQKHVEAQDSSPPEGTADVQEDYVNSDSACAQATKPTTQHPNSSFTSCLPEELCGLAQSEIMELCRDEHLAVFSCKVCKEDALWVVIFISNMRDFHIEGLSCQLSSDDLKPKTAVYMLIQTLSDPNPACFIPCLTSVSESATHTVSPMLGSQCVVASIHRVVMEAPTVQSTARGWVSYCPAAKQSETLHFSFKLSLADFIRPLLVTTEEYGRLWLSFANDVKQNLKLQADRGDTLAPMLSTLRDKLQLHIVHIIGTEGIVACQLVPGQPCLLHCHVHDGILSVWLRSPISDLPDCLLYHLQKALQEH